jgi:hypothetical protein
MKGGKATGLPEVITEMLKATGEEGIVMLKHFTESLQQLCDS